MKTINSNKLAYMSINIMIGLPLLLLIINGTRIEANPNMVPEVLFFLLGILLRGLYNFRNWLKS